MSLWLHSWWRRQWRSLAVIAVILGVAGGAAMAASAGARRSASAVDRFREQVRPVDMFFAAGPEVDPTPMRRLAEHPGVAGIARARFLWMFPEAGDDGGFVPLLAIEGASGEPVEQWTLVRGRHPDPSEPYEVVVAQQVARLLDVDVGDTTSWQSFTPEQAEALEESEDFSTPGGPPIELEVVGIGRAPSDIANREGDPAFTFVTPAFLDRHRDEIGTGPPTFMVALTRRDAAQDVVSAVERIYGDAPHPVTEGGVSGDDVVTDSVAVVTTALVLLAAVALIAGVGAVASAVGRHQSLAGSEVVVLRALGATDRGARIRLAAAITPGILAGALGAAIVAIAASPLLPIGLARRIDPDTGLHVDWLVLATGVCVLILAPTALGFVLAIRRPPVTVRSSPGLATRLSRALRPVPATGVRFALLPGAQRFAPRPAVLGSVVAVAGVVAVLIVATSSDRLLDTPERYGWGWDAAVSDDAASGLVDEEVVDAAAIGVFGTDVSVEGRPVVGVSIRSVKGTMDPPIIRGGAPRGAGEVALGQDTLDATGRSLGESVEVSAGGDPVELVVSGVAVLPSIEDPYPLAEGAVFTHEAAEAIGFGNLAPGDPGFRKLLLRFRDDVDVDEARAALGLPATETSDDDIAYPTPPPEIARLEEVRYVPAFLAALVAVLGVIAVGHALYVTVWRRSLDLAVLGALGFTPSQRRGSLRWQAVVLAAVAAVLGVPTGIIVGRAVWTVIAGSIGVATDAAVSAAFLGIVLVATTLMFLVLATLPAHRAGRLELSAGLRSE